MIFLHEENFPKFATITGNFFSFPGKIGNTDKNKKNCFETLKKMKGGKTQKKRK